MLAAFDPERVQLNDYFVLQKRLFRVVGISLDQHESKSYQIYSKFFVFFIIGLYPIIQLSDVFKFYNRMDILSDIITFTSLITMGLAKSMLVYMNRKDIGRTLKELECGVFVPDLKNGGPQEVVWLKRCIVNVNKQSFFFLGSVYLTMVVGITDCAFRRLTNADFHKWKFPLGSFSLFDVTYSPNYEIACVLQTFCVTVCFTALMTSDVLISGILAHIATQCVMLQNRIRLMVKNAHRRMLEVMRLNQTVLSEEDAVVDPSTIPWKYLEESLNEMVVYHMKIMELADKFEHQFSYLVLLQFLATCGTLCFATYSGALLTLTDFKFFQYMGGAVDIAIQVFLYCYWGNEVALQSQAVVNACYESDFVGTDLRFQKGLILMMKRSRRPIVLSAGKFTTLSLNTFIWIIRASYSYFMVLHRMQQ